MVFRGVGSADLNDQDSNGVPLSSVVRTLMHRWWVLSTGLLIGAAVAAVISAAMTPLFSATAVLYVTSDPSEGGQNAYQGSLASQQRVLSYAKLVSSEAVLERAIELGRLSMSVESARSAVTATSTENTVLLEVHATTPSPDGSAALANGVAESLSLYVSETERTGVAEAPLAKATVVTPASVSSDPSSPRVLLNVALGAFLGLLCGVLALLIHRRLDTRIEDPDQISTLLSAPVLASIPRDSTVSEDSSRPSVFGGGYNPAAESFRKLRTNLSFVGVDEPPRTILVTSSLPGEGKTSVSVNLAVALAEAGHKVALVDADLRRPMIGKRLGLFANVGFSDVLREAIGIDEAIQSAGDGALDVLCAGETPPNPSELLGSRKAESVMSELSDRFDYVIVDSPPISPVTDAILTAKLVDGVLLVVRSGTASQKTLSSVRTQLETSGIDPLGVVLNAVTSIGAGYASAYYYVGSRGIGDDAQSCASAKPVNASGPADG